MRRTLISKLLVVGGFAAAFALACGGPIGSASIAADGTLPSRLADLDLPLAVQDSAGVERTGDLCSTGIPLPLGLLQEPEGIAIFDERGSLVPVQFRVLERWRNFGEDKSIKWLLVTFFADVPKGGHAVYHLKAGKNPAPVKPVAIVEKADAFEMGGQLFKKDFSAPFKLVLTDPDGKQLTAADVPVTWSIWENGPVRACLKAETPTVHEKFGFIAWIYAYAGQDRWDLTVVLKNTPRKFRGPFFFRDFSVVWEPHELKGAKDFLLGGEVGKTVSGQINGPSACLYQASDGTDKWDEVKSWGRHHGLAGSQPEFRGYKAFAGDKELATGNVALGWAGLSGGGRGALACTRYFRPQYPKAVGVEPGRITVRLWPRQWESHGGLHWLDDMQRKAHDVSFRLLPKPATAKDGENAGKALDCFLVAHAPGAWYRGTSCEPVLEGWATDPTSLAKLWNERQAMGDWVVFGSDRIKPFRFHYHGGSLDPYALSGSDGAAYLLFVDARVNSGMVSLWLDDYQYPRDAKELKHAQYCNPLRDPHPSTGYHPGTEHHGWMPWNHSHFCCGELFDSWRLFGDPMALEAVKAVGAYCQSYVEFREGPKWKENIPRPLTHNAATWEGGGGLPAGSRADGMPLHNLCQAYSITGDESMMGSLRRFAAVAWRQVDKERGAYAPGVSPGPNSDFGLPKGTTTEDPSMVGQVMDGLVTYYSLTHDETAADQITGMLDWVIAEGTADKFGHLYHLVLNNGEWYATRRNAYIEGVRKSAGAYRFQIDPYLYAFAYHYTGDKYYRDQWMMLEEGRKELKAKLAGWMTALHYRSDKDLSEILGDPRKGGAPEAVKDLAAEALGGAKVKLTWTVPQGEPVRYQVKWSDRTIVERLLFDNERRTFKFDPKGHANWWAANNVEGEPKPGAAGARESMTVEGITPGKRFFAVRSFDAASNRSAMSNVRETAVR